MKLGLNKNITGTLDKKEPNQTWPNPRTSTSTHHNQKEGDKKNQSITQSKSGQRVTSREDERRGFVCQRLAIQSKGAERGRNKYQSNSGWCLVVGLPFFSFFFFLRYESNHLVDGRCLSPPALRQIADQSTLWRHRASQRSRHYGPDDKSNNKSLKLWVKLSETM